MRLKFLRLRPEAKMDDIVRAYNDAVMKLEAVFVGLDKSVKGLDTELAVLSGAIGELDNVKELLGSVVSEVDALEPRVQRLEGYHTGGSITS